MKNESGSTTIPVVNDDKEVVRTMKTKEQVNAILAMHANGMTAHASGHALGCSPHTVERYVEQGEWRPRRQAKGKLHGLESWLTERFLRHRGNADVVRQELLSELGIEVSLRTVERAVAPLRKELKVANQATVRYETKPGDQVQIDFGTKRVTIGRREVHVKLFVATLGWSRRQFVAAYENERQRAWLDGLERSFRHFDGVPRTALMDNPKALVSTPRAAGRAAVFHSRVRSFANYWGFSPRACWAGRPETKGKVENGVGYVKGNALAGREFADWSDLDRHLQRWMAEVADVRVHGTTGEAPMVRFALEQPFLTPLNDRPPFGAPADLTRKVSVDCAVSLDTNQYSVPWRLVGETVRLSVSNGTLRIYLGAELVAAHEVAEGRHRRVVDKAHFADLDVSHGRPASGDANVDDQAAVAETDGLSRPLEDYERLVEAMSP